MSLIFCIVCELDQLMLARCIRNFSSKRSIPYVTKGKWILPQLINTVQAKNDAQQLILESDTNINGRSDVEAWGSRPNEGVNIPKDWRRMRQLPQWKKQMFALKEKFPEGWKPPKKLDREKMNRIRQIKESQPQMNNNILGEMFQISPEAVRRILKSRWEPNPEESTKSEKRWTRRGNRSNSVKLNSSEESHKVINTKERKKRKSSDMGYTSSYARAGKRLKDPGQNIF